LYPCGTAKACVFYPRVPKRNKKNKGEDPVDDSEEGGGQGEGEIETTTTNDGDNMAMTMKTNDLKNRKKVTVLVNMLSPDQALKVVACFKHFTSQLDDQYKDMRCYMVPSSPDVPLPPPLVDETTQKVLGEKLLKNFNSLEEATIQNSAKSDNEYDKAGNLVKITGHETEGDNGKIGANDDENNDEPKLDANKVAAAAGGLGAYDAEEDPLNAPNVLAAVKEFRRKLDKTHGNQKTHRAELVAKRLKEARPRIRKIVDDEKKNQQEQLKQQKDVPPGFGRAPPPVSLPVPPQTSLLQPPLPGGGPPPPPPSLGLPPPRPVPGLERGTGIDSGKRGRSNLPAWMTQQQSEEVESNKKMKTTTESLSKDYPSHFPSTLPPSSHAMLRQFLANQVRESMGEEEATLIEFLHSHIIEGKATSELLQELQVVLEEEADSFLEAVWAKVQEIKQQ